jgi:hypothetical protein
VGACAFKNGFTLIALTSVHVCGGRGRMQSRAGYGRHIGFTKVKELPESLGKCPLFEKLCVRAAAACARGFACAGLPCMRAAPARALGVSASALGAGRRVAVAARPVAACRAACASTAGRRRAETALQSHCGAQGRVQHRARGVAGGIRLAPPYETVSARRSARPPSAVTVAARDATVQEGDPYTCI